MRPTPSGHQAESRAAMSEDGVRSGDSTVTRECEVETSAHAMAFDGGDDRGGIGFDCVHEPLSEGGELVGFRAGQRIDFVQVGADGEELGFASDD